MIKKKIQIFYGGFKFIKGGVNTNSNILKNYLKKKYEVSLYTLDSLPIYVKFVPHLVEKVVNFFFLPLGFYYKDILTRFLFKFFFNKKNIDYRIFQDIYLSWNSSVPSVTILHAIWSDNLQKYKLDKKKILALKKKEIKKINSIDHNLCTVSIPYEEYIRAKHFTNKVKKKIKVVDLGIKNFFIKKKKRIDKSLIYVGALEKRKNVLFMLKVFQKLYKYDKKYSLTIIGTGPDESKLKEITNNFALPIKFLGNKTSKEIFNELSKHEIYIHTSVKESFSLSLLEAKIAGLSTIAYKHLQVPKEFIDYGVDGFKEYKWFKMIISIKRNQRKFKYKKYLIKNTSNKLLELAK